MSMKCPKCGREIPEESKFCMHCGATTNGESLSMPIEEAAQLIGCSHQTVLNLIERGLIDRSARGLKRKTYVTRDSVLAFCEGCPEFTMNQEELDILRHENIKSMEKMRRLVTRKNFCDALVGTGAAEVLLLHLCRMYLTEREGHILRGLLLEGRSTRSLADEMCLSVDETLRIKETALRKLSQVGGAQVDSYRFLMEENERLRKLADSAECDSTGLRQTPLCRLGLTGRALGAFRRAGVVCMEDFQNVTMADILEKAKRSGTIKEILRFIYDYRIETGGENDEELLMNEIRRTAPYLCNLDEFYSYRKDYWDREQDEDYDDNDEDEDSDIEAEELYDENE